MARKPRKDMMGAAEPKLDMSPMIDLVFLLLIFFMIASTMITYKKDKNVKVVVASASIKPGDITGRIVINVYADGTVVDENSKPISLDEVEQIMTKAKSREPNTRLHIRADQRVPHKKVKEVIAASARGGVSDVIFSAHVKGIE